jgi:hypothetical protein
VFGPVMESYGLSPHSLGPPGSEVNDAQVDSWRDCFGISLLGDDVFSGGLVRWTV